MLSVIASNDDQRAFKQATVLELIENRPDRMVDI